MKTRTSGPDLPPSSSELALSLDRLSVSYHSSQGVTQAVKAVSFSIEKCASLCLVGESGSGKSSLALSIPRILPSEATVTGKIYVQGEDVLGLLQKQLLRLRREKISYIFQDARGSLLPHVRIGKQLQDTVSYRQGLSSQKEAKMTSRTLLDKVNLSADAVWNSYPSELSGGMCQRVMIALALSTNPSLVIADEPTSALDAVTQDQVLELLIHLQEQQGFGMLFVTHDLRIARQLADTIGVMRRGELIEVNEAEAFYSGPEHPYARKLLRSARKLSL